MHASTVAFALFAASQVLAAPTPANNNNARSLSAIGDAIGNFAEDVLGDHTAKRNVDERSLSAIENFFSNLKRSEDLDARSLSAIENFFSNLKRDAPDARSLSAIGDAIGNFAEEVVGPHIGKRDVDLDARSLSAIENFFSNLKRSEGVDARSLSAIEGVVHDIFGKRSLKAVGAAVAGGVASGVAGAVASDVLGRSEPSGVMVDTETGTIYMDIPDSNEGRSLKAVGAAVAGGVASGVAGAVASDVLGKRSDSGLMVDTETGTLYMDIPDANGARSLKAVGAAVAGGVASGVAGAVASDVLGRSEPASGLMVDTETGTLYMDIPDANGARSLKAVGAAVAGGVASGVAGAVASDVLGRSEPSGLMVDTETGTIYMDVPDATQARSLKAVGAAVAGGVASGVAGAVASDVLGRSEPSGLMVDTETGTLYMDVPDANGARSLKAVGAAVAGGVASGVAGAVASDVLGRSEPSNEGRSLKAVGAAVAGGVASGVAGAVASDVLGRSEPSGLMVDTETGTLYMDIPDSNGARSLKAVGAAVAGGVASGVAGAVASDVLGRAEPSGIMVDTETGTIYMDIPDAQNARSLKAVGAAVAGGVASLATGAVANEVLGNDKRSLSAIEGVIDDIFNKRSLSAIENFFSNLKRDDSAQAINYQIKQILQRSQLAETMAKRSIDDLE